MRKWRSCPKCMIQWRKVLAELPCSAPRRVRVYAIHMGWGHSANHSVNKTDIALPPSITKLVAVFESVLTITKRNLWLLSLKRSPPSLQQQILGLEFLIQGKCCKMQNLLPSLQWLFTPCLIFQWCLLIITTLSAYLLADLPAHFVVSNNFIPCCFNVYGFSPAPLLSAANFVNGHFHNLLQNSGVLHILPSFLNPWGGIYGN